MTTLPIDPRKERIVSAFLEHRIALVNEKEPFVLASGARSPVYLDHRRAFSVPGLREDLAALWADTVRSSDVFQSMSASDAASLVVAGTATAGIAPAYALATALGARFVYVRAKPKGHGLGRMVEGVWDEGAPCLVVDDMVTTGGSLLEAARNVCSSGGRALFATSITRHDFARTRAAFESASLPLVTCFTSEEIFAVAARIGLLGTDGLNAVRAWLAAQDTPS